MVAVGHQVVRGVNVFQTFLVVGSPPVVDELVLLLDLDGVDGLPVDEFLGICCIVFREIHVDEAGEGMSVGSNSNVSMFVGHPVDNLFLESSTFISVALVVGGLGIEGVVVHDPLLFLGIEFCNFILLFLLNLIFVIFLELSYLFIMFFFEFQVLLHDTVHVIFINVHIDHFFAFFQGLILIFQT